jgi:riboflavin biosynthesis pyrimidine reductase
MDNVRKGEKRGSSSEEQNDVLTAIGTVKADDPEFTARIKGKESAKDYH